MSGAKILTIIMAPSTFAMSIPEVVTLTPMLAARFLSSSHSCF